MIRANHKGPIETVETAGISVVCNIEAGTEIAAKSACVIEARAERLDEAGIT